MRSYFLTISIWFSVCFFNLFGYIFLHFCLIVLDSTFSDINYTLQYSLWACMRVCVHMGTVWVCSVMCRSVHIHVEARSQCLIYSSGTVPASFLNIWKRNKTKLFGQWTPGISPSLNLTSVWIISINMIPNFCNLGSGYQTQAFILAQQTLLTELYSQPQQSYHLLKWLNMRV